MLLESDRMDKGRNVVGDHLDETGVLSLLQWVLAWNSSLKMERDGLGTVGGKKAGRAVEVTVNVVHDTRCAGSKSSAASRTSGAATEMHQNASDFATVLVLECVRRCGGDHEVSSCCVQS